MIHVYEIATGRLVEICREGSDVSRFWTSSNYIVLTGKPTVDKSGVRVDIKTHRYVDGRLAAKTKEEMEAKEKAEQRDKAIGDYLAASQEVAMLAGIEHLDAVADRITKAQAKKQAALATLEGTENING